jgi:hypothetical protein
MKPINLIAAGALLLSGSAIAQTTGNMDTTTEPGSTNTSPASDPMPIPSTSESGTAPTDPTMGTTQMPPSDPATSGTTMDSGTDATTNNNTTTMGNSGNATSGAMTGSATVSSNTAQAIERDWSRYDEGNKGQLTRLEFGKWIMAAQGQDMSSQVDKSKAARTNNSPAIKVLNATGSEFTKADTSKDGMVSREELASYLSGGQA